MTKSTGIGRGNNPDSHGNAQNSSAHHRWKPGGAVASNGYVKIRVGKTHPLADKNGYAYEHRLVWAAADLPAPTGDEVIHHINEDKTDNRIENLEVRSRASHSIAHTPSALEDWEVRKMRDEFQGGDHTGVLAKRYGVRNQYVWRIVRGMTRRSAGGPIVDGQLRKARAGRLLDGREHNEVPE